MLIYFTPLHETITDNVILTLGSDILSARGDDKNKA